MKRGATERKTNSLDNCRVNSERKNVKNKLSSKYKRKSKSTRKLNPKLLNK